MNFNNVNSQSWKINTLIVGASIKYPIYETIEPEPLPIKEETIFNRDTLLVYDAKVKSEQVILLDKSETNEEIETEDYLLKQKTITEKYQKTLPKVINLACDMEIYGILPDGTKQATPTLIIEETEVIESFPVLPQVFFKENSADLTMTGLNLLQPLEVERFDAQKLDKSTLKLYENMLNIIGYRMRFNPKANIKIIGTNKNKGVETNNQELSNNRAIAIKKYLVETWQINEKRIDVIKRNLPQNPGNSNIVEGEIENQRAEIYSDDFEILKPINITTLEKSSNPPTLAVKPIITNDVGEENTDNSHDNSINNVVWNVEISQNSKLLRRSTSDLEKDGVYDWNVLDEPIPMLENPIEVKLDAKNEFGGICSKTSSIEIKQLTIKKKRFELKDDNRIEKYALIVFDFDQSKLTEQHRTILKEIKSKIEPNSKVKILGFTDKIGEEDYNENLAKRRAEEVQSYLNVAADKLELKAIGSKELLYDNSTPQGRAFCRTVIIEIETPVKE
jgi:outer membrane protein OmpA-like peptidoglycan-associated protein